MILPRCEKFAHLAVRVIEVAEVHAVSRTDGDTCRIQSFFNPMDTECAFISVSVWVNKACIVWTRGNTCFAANALIMGHKNNAAEIVYVTCPGRAAINTRRIIAMITPFSPDFHMKIRIFTAHILHNPIAVECFGNIVLGFASNNAVHAADAFFRIDHHSKACHNYPSTSMVTKFTFMPVPPMSGSVSNRVINCESLAPFPNACFNPFAVWPNPCTI
jgi:hypothetical protein